MSGKRSMTYPNQISAFKTYSFPSTRTLSKYPLLVVNSFTGNGSAIMNQGPSRDPDECFCMSALSLDISSWIKWDESLGVTINKISHAKLVGKRSGYLRGLFPVFDKFWIVMR